MDREGRAGRAGRGTAGVGTEESDDGADVDADDAAVADDDSDGTRERADVARGGAGGTGDGSTATESMPAFVRYGVFTVFVYAAAVGALVGVPSVEVHDPSLVAFTVGFSVFMTVYFGSMWVGWLFVR